MSPRPAATIGDNLGPVLIPTEDQIVADLQDRYPQVEKDLKECVDAAEEYPETINDDETAGALQALIKKMKTHRAAWKAWRGVEKRPFDTLAKVIMNFFAMPEEKLGEAIDKLQPRYTAFLEMKAERQRQDREAAAEREREAAEELRMDQLWAEARAELAQYDERKAREREEAARRAEEEAKQRQAEAERKAKAAAEEAQRLEREKRDRENAERSENANIIRQMKALMKDAERLAKQAQEELLLSTQEEVLADLVLEGGEISRLGGRLLRSTLLDEEQKTWLETVKTQLATWRAEHAKRAKAEEEREVARRKAIREEQERQAAAEAAEREKRRKEEEARIATARAQAEAAERERDEAEARAKAAKADVREARGDAREAIAEQKSAAREATTVGRQADKVGARADRMDRRLEGASDADMSRTRGEYGTVGSLSGRYAVVVEDRDALVAYFGPLGIYLLPDAMDAAVFRYMQANQGQWQEEQVRTEIPGVLFDWTPEARIK